MAGAAFVAGAALHPIAGQYGGSFTQSNTMTAAYVQDEDRRNTYQLLKDFGDAFELARSRYVDPVTDQELIENAISGMLTGLDPHSDYMGAEALREMDEEDRGVFVGVGIEVSQENGVVRVTSVINDTPAARAGVKPGDYIIGVNSERVQELSLDDILRKMRGRPNTKITVTIGRGGVSHPVTVSMRRTIVHPQVVDSRLVAGRIGYARIAEFVVPADGALKRAVRSLRRRAGGKLTAFILDLRDNPGGLIDVAVTVAREFIRHGLIASTRGRYAEDSVWFAAEGMDILGGAPMVVLINSGSASASEMVAGALQDHCRAILIGTRTFGKGSVQTTIPLPGDRALLLTTARYYTPSGVSIQGRGIVPDVVVTNSRSEQAHFDPEQEADLNHVLRATGGVSDSDNQPRSDLPPIVKSIPNEPPTDFPDFDSARPETDFQLLQALLVAKAIADAQCSCSAH